MSYVISRQIDVELEPAVTFLAGMLDIIVNLVNITLKPISVLLWRVIYYRHALYVWNMLV